MIKKMTLLSASVSLGILLAACTQTANPVENSDETQNSNLTLEEVFTKSITANEEISSLKADMVIDQNLKLPTPDEELSFDVDTTTDIQMQMVTDPIALYQVSETTSEGLGQIGNGELMTMESYLTNDGFFLFDSTKDQWMKLPSNLSDEVLKLSQSQTNPSEQMKDLQKFEEEFTFEQDDSSYILTLNASGEKFTEFLQQQASETMPDLGGSIPAEEVLQDTLFEDVQYEIVIDKNTFLASDFNMRMTLTMNTDGETMKITQDMKSTFTEYNTVDEITIPQEVLDTAVEMPF